MPEMGVPGYPDLVGGLRRRGRRLGVRLELGAPAHQPTSPVTGFPGEVAAPAAPGIAVDAGRVATG